MKEEADASEGCKAIASILENSCTLRRVMVGRSSSNDPGGREVSPLNHQHRLHLKLLAGPGPSPGPPLPLFVFVFVSLSSFASSFYAATPLLSVFDGELQALKQYVMERGFDSMKIA
eukprot:762924-Hanusia_phi.AAC.3